MAESVEDIVNDALLLIGHTDLVDDIETEDSTEATVANQIYVKTRNRVLKVAPWPFATARERPAAIDATTLALGEVPGGWTYAFVYPTTAVVIRAIYAGTRNPTEAQKVSYVVEYDTALQARVILTDESEPELVFTTLLEDFTAYPDDFAAALSAALAIQLAAALRKDAATVKLARDAYDSAIGEAWANAKTESRGEPQPDPDFISERW